MTSKFPFTREDAVKHIEKIYDRSWGATCSLPAEPVAIFYGETMSNSNVILAIGRGGDGKEALLNQPYYLIDFSKLSEDVANIKQHADEVDEIVAVALADIENLKERMQAAETEVINIWAKIGNKTDGNGLDTVYGYINDNVMKIMGGTEPLKGLSNIIEIGTAVSNNRTRIGEIYNDLDFLNSNLNTAVNALTSRDNDLQSQITTLNETLNEEISDRLEYDKIEADVRAAAIQAEADLRAEADKIESDIRAREDLRLTQEIAAEITARESAVHNAVVESKGYADEKDKEVLNQAKAYADQSETDAFQTAKDYIDGREDIITKEYQAYADKSKTDAIESAKAYTAEREREIVAGYKSYTDTKVNDSHKKLTLVSDDKSVIIGAQTENGTNVKVNIDGNTIVQDESTGQLRVSSSALVQYVGDGAIEISDAINGTSKKVSLKINENDSVLVNETTGLFANLSLKWVKNDGEGQKDEIQLIGKEGRVISSIDVAEFLKDGMLESVTLNSDDVENPKLIFVFNSISGKDTIEVPVKDLIHIEVYKAGDGLELVDSTFKVKLDPTSESMFLTNSLDGLKLSGVKNYVDETKNRVDVIEPKVLALESNLASEIQTRFASDTVLQEQIEGVKTTVDGVKSELETAIGLNTEKIDVLNSGLGVDGSVKETIFKSVIGDIITTISPEDAKSQSLLRKISVEGYPYFYVSNDAHDIRFDERSLYDVVDELVIINSETNKPIVEIFGRVESLETAVTAHDVVIKDYEERIEALEEKNIAYEKEILVLNTTISGLTNEILGLNGVITGMTSELSELKNGLKALQDKINSGDLDVNYDEVLNVVKTNIITPEVFKAAEGDLKVEVDTENCTVTYGFDDNAGFVADSYTEDDLKLGGSYSLTNNIVSKDVIQIENGVTTNVNLNGKKISA